MAKKEVRRTPLNEGVNLLDAFDLMNQRQSSGSLARIQSRRNINQPIDNTESLLANVPSQENMVMPVSNVPNIGLLNTTQQQPNIANNVFGMSNNMQSQTAQQPISDRNQRIGYMLAALSDAFAGRDVAGRALQRGQILRQQQAEERQRQQQIQTQQTLQQYLTPEQYSFYLAGVPLSDIAEFTSQQRTDKSIEQLQQEATESAIPSEGLENLEEAFGGADYLQQGINVALGPFVGTLAPETSEATRAKNVLNERLRETFVSEYSGRPSVYISQRVDQLLPTSGFISESEAANQYREIQRVLKQGAQELESNIKSGLFKGVELQKLQNEYKKSTQLINDITIGLSSLPKRRTTLEPSQQVPETSQPGSFDDYFTNT
tara:strand:- start:2585 stop:3712 length:1128 start_codon:yes stop_codon:yes gene_type:complete